MELILIAVLAFAMMWWMSNRSKKQQRAALSFRDSLEVGQEVMTGSGLFGVIVDVEEDRITLETEPGGARTVWLRAAIAKLVDPPVVEEAEGDEVSDVDEALAGITDATEQDEAAASDPYRPDEDDQTK